jgi:hypothetical protein
MGCAGPAQPEPGQASAFGDEARHDTEMKHVVPCRPVGPEAKPGHGLVAFKRVVLCQRPVRPYCARSVRIYKIWLFFLKNLVILIKKLFNVTKFKLKT